MNTAIQKITALYVNQFMDLVSERFTISKEDLENLWKESQKIRPTKKTMPKKKASNYTVFGRIERKSLKQEQPDLTFSEISKEVASRWKLLSPEQKKTYREPEPEPIEDGTRTPVITEDDPPPSPAMVVESVGRILEESVAPMENDEEETVAEFPEIPKTKKTRKKGAAAAATAGMPVDLDETQQGLWEELSGFKLKELRKQCENNNLKTSKFRKDMIMSLITHRIALENGHLPMEDEEDDRMSDDMSSHDGEEEED